MNTNLLKLNKGPIANNTGQRLTAAQNAAAPVAENSNNSVLQRTVDNIVNYYPTSSTANAVPLPLKGKAKTHGSPSSALKTYNGNGIIGSYMENKGLPGSENQFMQSAKNTYENAVKQAVQNGIARRNSKSSLPQSPAATSPTSEGARVQSNPEIVQVRSYVSPYSHLPLTYDSDLGKVYLGGREVPIAHISADGRSYAKKSDLDTLINDLRYSDPYSKDAVIQRIVDSGDDVYDAVNRLKQREKFNYNYRTDPVYQAYVSQYDAMRDDAVREAISANVARTGGLMNSNAASVAHQTAAEYDRMKANIIPTLEAQAYERYASENQLNNEAAAAIGNMVNSYIGNMASIYGQQDSRDLSKYEFDKELAQNESQFVRENDRAWAGLTAEDNVNYRNYLLDLQQLGLTERQISFNEWLQMQQLNLDRQQLGLKYSGKTNSGSNNNAGTGVPIG